MPRLYTLKYAKFSVCDSIFHVRIFSSTVASPIASLKCLRVGCEETKTRKRLRSPTSGGFTILPYVTDERDAKFSLLSQSCRFQRWRVLRHQNAFALGTQRRESFRAGDAKTRKRSRLPSSAEIQICPDISFLFKPADCSLSTPPIYKSAMVSSSGNCTLPLSALR